MIARTCSKRQAAVAMGRSLAADGLAVPSTEVLFRAFETGLAALVRAEEHADRVEDARYDVVSGVGAEWSAA